MGLEHDSDAALLRPAWVEIDLDALTRNLARLRGRVGGARVLAVVKADAYGHDAVAVARALERADVEWLGVALVEEGVELRRHGVSAPILMLGPVQRSQIALLCRHRLVPVVSSLEQLRIFSEWSTEHSRESPQEIHLEVDTGMHRLGVPESEWGEALGVLQGHEDLRLDGLLSHFAESEVLSSQRNARQEAQFEKAIAFFCRCEGASDSVARAGERPKVPWIHLANSAAALHRPSSCFGLVRAGLALYGVDPAAKLDELEPVLSLKARVVQRHTLDVGHEVGYGGQWTADRPSVIGTVPIGYADGYHWRLGNRASVLVEGQRVPVIGAVGMDLLSIDMTDSDAGPGATVTLIGVDGAEEITVTELAALAGTLPYELLCHLGLRLHRRVSENGTEIAHSTRCAIRGQTSSGRERR